MLSNKKKRQRSEGKEVFLRKRRVNDGSETAYSQRHQRLLRSKRNKACKLSLAWLHGEGFHPSKLEIVNTRIETTESVTFSQAGCQGLLGSTEEPNQDEVDVVNMMLYVKDNYCISGDGYHEMAKACKSMPRHCRIKTRIRELNNLWNIQPTPNGIVGAQQSLEERLRACIAIFLKPVEEHVPFKSSHVIRVKLTGDGTWVGKRLHLVNFAFTMLDEGPLAYSYEGNHPLAIFSTSEKL